MKNNSFKPLPPFKGWVLQNFPFIEEDFDAITSYQLWCKVVAYLNNTNNNVNVLAKEVLDIKNYLDNLDIQDEVNNKLDEMAESGQLTDIIAQYLQLAGILAYNTLNDLKNASNLSNGSFTETYGKNSYNDGLGAKYKIRTLNNTDIIDNDNLVALTNYPTLIAEKIKTFDNTYFIRLNRIGQIKIDNGKRYEIPVNSYDWGQGMAILNDKLYQAFIGNDTGVKIRKYDLSGNLLKEEIFEDIAHCDSIGKNIKDNILFLVDSNKIIAINENLETLGELNIPEELNSYFYFSYDTSTNHYIIGNKNKINEVTLDNEYNITLINSFDITPLNNYSQSGTVDNGKIYILYSNPNRVGVYSNKGELINIIYLPNIVQNIFINETEGISINDDKIYITSTQHYQALDMYSWTNLFVGNLYNNIDENTNIYNYPPSENIYVNSSANVWLSDGSEDHPFTEICEAINFIKNGNYSTNNNLLINVANGNYEPIRTENINNITIEGSTETVVDYLKIDFSNNINLRNIIISPIHNLAVKNNTSIYSNINLYNCLFDENILEPIYTARYCNIKKLGTMSSENYTDANLENGDIKFFNLINSKLECNVPVTGVIKDNLSIVPNGIHLIKKGAYQSTDTFINTLNNTSLNNAISNNHIKTIKVNINNRYIEINSISATLEVNITDNDWWYHAFWNIDDNNNTFNGGGYKVSKSNYSIGSYSGGANKIFEIIGY